MAAAPDEVGKFLATQKVQRALAAAEDGASAPAVEYFVDGTAVEMAPGQVSCLLESDDGNVANIIIADGQFTGTEFSVPSEAITAAEASYLEQGVRDLFSSGVEKHVD